MVCLSRPYPLKFFKGYFPQILLGPFLNASSQMYLKNQKSRNHSFVFKQKYFLIIKAEYDWNIIFLFEVLNGIAMSGVLIL